MRALLQRKGKQGREGDRMEMERKGKGRYMADQCQTASYAPEL